MCLTKVKHWHGRVYKVKPSLAFHNYAVNGLYLKINPIIL